MDITSATGADFWASWRRAWLPRTAQVPPKHAPSGQNTTPNKRRCFIFDLSKEGCRCPQGSRLGSFGGALGALGRIRAANVGSLSSLTGGLGISQGILGVLRTHIWVSLMSFEVVGKMKVLLHFHLWEHRLVSLAALGSPLLSAGAWQRQSQGVQACMFSDPKFGPKGGPRPTFGNP